MLNICGVNITGLEFRTFEIEYGLVQNSTFLIIPEKSALSLLIYLVFRLWYNTWAHE